MSGFSYLRVGAEPVSIENGKIMLENMARVYSVFKLWGMIETLVPNSNFVRKVRKKPEFFSLIYSEEIAETIQPPSYDVHVPNGGFGNGTQFAKKYKKQLLNYNGIMQERARLEKLFEPTNSWFDNRERNILKTLLIERYLFGGQFFKTEDGRCMVTPQGYFEMLEDLKAGKPYVKGINICGIRWRDSAGNINKRKDKVELEELFDIQASDMKKECIYTFEDTVESDSVLVNVFDVGGVDYETVRGRVRDFERVHTSIASSEYDLKKSTSKYAELYQSLSRADDTRAMISAIMCICSLPIVGEVIQNIFDWRIYQSNSSSVEKIIADYHQGNYLEVAKKISEFQKDMGKREWRFLFYFQGKLQEKNGLERYLIQKEPEDCYRECISGMKSNANYHTKEDWYIGAAAYELALLLSKKKKTVENERDIKRCVKLAKACGYNDIYELEGDMYISEVSNKDARHNYEKAYQAYGFATSPSSKRKRLLCAKEIVKCMGEDEEANEFLVNAMLEASRENVEEAVVGLSVDQARKEAKKRVFGNDIGKKEQSIELKLRTTFVVVGYGDATKAFLRSLESVKNKTVYLLIWNLDQEKKEKLQKLYPFAHVENYELEKVLMKIGVYNLNESESDFPYMPAKEKVIFVGLTNRTVDNISFAMEVMKRTWEKQMDYEERGIYSLLDETVEMVLEVEDGEAQLYVDALQKRFGEFYIPIRFVDYANEVSKELLLEYPLFVPFIKERKYSYDLCQVIIFGDDPMILQLVKNILSVGWFGREDYKGSSIAQEKYMTDKLSITIVDKNATAILERLKYDCPEYFQNRMIPGCIPKAYNIDVQSYKFSELFENQHVNDELSNEQKELRHQLFECTYMICAMKQDTDNIALGMKLRQMMYAGSVEKVWEPEIAVLCRKSMYAENVNEFKVGNELITGGRYSDYHLHVFGVYYKCFSYQNLCHNMLDELALNVHTSFCGDNAIERDQALNSYYSKFYNRDSSEMTALYFIYRLFSAKAFDDWNDWNINQLSEKIGSCINCYNDYIGDKENTEKLAIYEHFRWCNFMMTRGWKRSNEVQVRNYLKNGNTSHQLHIAKLHPFLATWSELGNRNGEVVYDNGEELEKCVNYFKSRMTELFRIFLSYTCHKYEEMNEKLKIKGFNVSECVDVNKLEYARCFGDAEEIIRNADEKKMSKLYKAKLLELDKVLEDCPEQLVATYKHISKIDEIVYNIVELVQCIWKENINEKEKINIIEFKHKIEHLRLNLKDTMELWKEYRKMELDGLSDESLEIMDEYLGNVKSYLDFISDEKNMYRSIERVFEAFDELLNLSDTMGTTESTGIQKWIDTCLSDYHLKVDKSSIREKNRTMIKDTLEILRDYLSDQEIDRINTIKDAGNELANR